MISRDAAIFDDLFEIDNVILAVEFGDVVVVVELCMTERFGLRAVLSLVGC